MKTCTTCKKEKDESEFGKRTNRKGGLQTNCKVCAREIVRQWARSHQERVCAKTKRWQDRHPQKVRAHLLVRSAILKGEIVRFPCEVCGKVEVDAHHDDYNKPLDVRWLCPMHHAQHHARERALEKERAAA